MPAGRVRELVHALEVARCQSFKSMSDGMDFIRSRAEWVELISPAHHEELVRLVEHFGGVERMNSWAKVFYTAALRESARAPDSEK